MRVDILAKTNLSQLVEAAERGEDVIITRNGAPVVQMVPLGKRKVNFGFLEGKLPPIADELLFSMSESDAHRFIEGED